MFMLHILSTQQNYSVLTGGHLKNRAFQFIKDTAQEDFYFTITIRLY